MKVNGNLVREKEQSLARMKEVEEDIKKLDEQQRQLEEELETVKYDATKEAIQNRIWKLMWKTNEYIMIWDDLRCRVDMLEKLLKEQNGEVE